MLVFNHARLVVLSIPRTGTTSFETTYAPYASISIKAPPTAKHYNLLQYERRVLGIADMGDIGAKHYDIAVVVREPLDWLRSWYQYRCRAEIDGHAASCAGIPFERFVEEWLSDAPAEFAHVGRPTRFIAPTGKGLRVTHVFAHERRDVFARFLEKRVGVAPIQGIANQSPPMQIKDPDALRAKIKAAAPDEYALWDRAMKQEA